VESADFQAEVKGRGVRGSRRVALEVRGV